MFHILYREIDLLLTINTSRDIQYSLVQSNASYASLDVVTNVRTVDGRDIHFVKFTLLINFD